MIINEFVEKLDFPEKARVDKKVFKTVFFKNVRLSKSQTDIFTNGIEDIRWIFALKEENINIPSLKNEDFDYSEIQVIGVNIRNNEYLDKITEIIHKNIQFPVIAIFEYENKVSISVGIKRINKSDVSKSVVEEIYNTDWIDGSAGKERKFMESIKAKNLSFINFNEFYRGFADRVKLFIACVYKDDYHYENPDKTEKIFNQYLKIKELEEKENKLKNLIKSASSISEKVRLNISIKDIENNKIAYIERIN